MALAPESFFWESDRNETHSSFFLLVTQHMTHVLFTKVWGKCVCSREGMQSRKVVKCRKAYLGLPGVLCRMNDSGKSCAAF